STNAVIRQYLGTFEDFVLTTLSLQKNNSNFADKGQTDRKDLIARFVGIVIFDKLYNNAVEETREMNTFLKKFKKENFSEQLVQLEFGIHDATEKFEQMDEVLTAVNEQRDSIGGEITDLRDRIVNLSDVPDDVIPLEADLDKYKNDLSEIDVMSMANDCDMFVKENSLIAVKIKYFEDKGITELKEEFDSWKVDLDGVENELEIDKVSAKNLLDKVQFLDEHKYDPDCKYCMENVFVKDALGAKVELAKLRFSVEEKVKIRKGLRAKIETSKVEDEFDQYKTLLDEFKNNETEWHKCINKVKELEKSVMQIENEIGQLERQIKRYYDAKDTVEENLKIKEEISILQSTEDGFTKKLKFGREKMMGAKSDIEVLKSQKSEIKKKVKEVREMESKIDLFEYYTAAIGRDGVPYDLICQAVPSIETEVNNILGQIVDFGMTIDMDGKNINANIVREDRAWPLELVSGMESFISNLALRIALSNVSNLPRSNFLIIDEGLGALDAEHLAAVYSLFDYLKTQFEFIILISHIDTSRDMVDMQLEIKKENGFSRINC
ncbi:MAG: hypothetical protein ACXACA_00880, partial [Candidatus Ranarchaeia archaeon]